jgi:small subunit ribosomal protein S6
MRKYELMYIVRTDVEQDAVQAFVEKVNGVAAATGEISKTDVIGKRRLAYEIDKYRDGFYVLVHFTATQAGVKELDRVLRISDEVIRHLIVNDVA